MRHLPLLVVLAGLMACAGPSTSNSNTSETSGAATTATSAGATTTNAGTTTGNGSTTGAGSTSGNVNQADLYESGSRLKAEVLNTPDGAQAFLGWYDSQLQIDCSFATASDGQVRCLPNLGSIVKVSGYFSDASCSERLVAGTCANMQTPAYAYSQQQVGDCSTNSGNQLLIYPVTGTYTGTVYEGTPSDCFATSSDFYTFYSVGPEIDPTTFVAGTKSVLQ